MMIHFINKPWNAKIINDDFHISAGHRRYVSFMFLFASVPRDDSFMCWTAVLYEVLWNQYPASEFHGEALESPKPTDSPKELTLSFPEELEGFLQIVP